MKKHHILLLVLISCTTLFAHSAYLPLGESGSYLKSEYTAFSENLFRLHYGYVSEGGLNINGVIGIPRHVISELDPNVRYGQMPMSGEALLGVDMEYLLVRQNETKLPFNVSLNTSYRLGVNWYSSGIYLTNNYVRIGCGISKRDQLSDRMTVVPSLSINLCRNINSYANGYYGIGPTLNWNDYLILSAGVNFLMKNIFIFWDIDYIPGMDINDLFANPWASSHLGIGFIIHNKQKG